MILVDTSSWIHLLRPDGDRQVRKNVEAALVSGEACWCEMVQLELWNGARGDQEKRVLRDFSRVLPELPISREVWQRAFDLARRARAQGLTVPATDVVIAACARHHGADMEAADKDFDLLSAVA